MDRKMSKGLWNIKKKAKEGLVILVAGAMIGIGGMAYAKEVNNEGWPLPDETQYCRLSDPGMRGIPCKYEEKELTVNVKVEPYVSMNNVLSSFVKYSFGDKVFTYVLIKPEGSCVLRLTILVDRDGNGSLETKYEIKEKKDEEEYNKDGMVPKWILEEVLKKTEY